MIGFFLLRDGGPPVFARIQGELYVLVFSDSQRAAIARATLGVDGAQPFYVCAANSDEVVRELRAAGARGFILDYDPSDASFSAAGAIPASP
jgi:hypothetical protein